MTGRCDVPAAEPGLTTAAGDVPAAEARAA
jgi:hypothetical protein